MLQSEMSLAGGAAFAQDDAVEPVIADHAAPQRVVEVEHQTFLRQTSLGGENAGGKIAVEGRRLRRDFQFPLKPASDIEPGVDAVALTCPRDIEKEHAVLRRGLAGSSVEPCDNRRRRAGNQPVIAAEKGLGHVHERLLDDRRAADIARLAPQGSQFRDEPPDRALDFGGRRVKPDAGDRLAGAEREQHRLRLKSMQGRRRIQEVLTVLPVGSADGRRSAIFAASRRPELRATDDRRSRRRGWRAGPAESQALP